MKKTVIFFAAWFIAGSVSAQQEEEVVKDTTRMNMGKTEIIVIRDDSKEDEEYYIDEGDTVYFEKKRKSEAHWAGIDFGFTMLMNDGFDNSFPATPYWNNDPAKSVVWNLNLFEHKFQIAREYFGITTGLGFSFTSVGFKENYVLFESADTLFASIDTVNSYTKNKLKASYLTVPLLLEFNTNADADKSFYLATGLVGGVRLTSKVVRKGEFNNKEFVEKDKGRYGLNPFKLDATVRMGYSNFGAFASYSLLPLFEDGKTVEVYPFTFGLSMNF